ISSWDSLNSVNSCESTSKFTPVKGAQNRIGVRPSYSGGTVRSAWVKPSRMLLSPSSPPAGAPQAARPAPAAPTPIAARRRRRERVRGLRDMGCSLGEVVRWRTGVVMCRGRSFQGAGGEAADDALLGEEEDDQHRQ